MDWAKILRCDPDTMSEEGLTRCQSKAVRLATTTARAIDQEVALDPNAPVPAQALQMPHQIGICEATISQKHNLAASW